MMKEIDAFTILTNVARWTLIIVYQKLFTLLAASGLSLSDYE